MTYNLTDSPISKMAYSPKMVVRLIQPRSKWYCPKDIFDENPPAYFFAGHHADSFTGFGRLWRRHGRSHRSAGR